MSKPITPPRAMKKLYAFGTKRKIDMSLSENPLGCSDAAMETLRTMKLAVSEYPKPSGSTLKTALAKRFLLSPDNFFIGNGSESIISNLTRVFGQENSEAVMPALSFPMFNICSALAGLTPVVTPMNESLGIDLGAMKKTITDKTAIVFICNPNNPTGAVLAKKDLVLFMDSVPSSTLVVIDEANIEFGGESVVDKVSKRSNLLVLRTFSKGFGLAGLRVGFAVGQAALIQKLEEETPAFPVSELSEQIAIAALADQDFIEKTRIFVASEREKLTSQLIKLGFMVFPSQANNLFVKIPNKLSARQFNLFLETADISVVMGSNFEGFDDRFFRLSVRDAMTNRKFVGEVKRFFY